MELEAFLSQVSDFDGASQSRQIDYFVYYITQIRGDQVATVAGVNQCFADCDLQVPDHTASRMSQKLSQKPPKLVKTASGYKLHRSQKLIITEELNPVPIARQGGHGLRHLESSIGAGPEKVFLKEAIDCVEIGANRAAVVMVWLLSINHLQRHVLGHKLEDFNAALAKRTEKKLKSLTVTSVDDFADINEGVFIALCRSANIISNDVRKILDQKLGIRNTAAHPSAVMVRESKVIDFVEDLVENILKKFPV